MKTMRRIIYAIAIGLSLLFTMTSVQADPIDIQHGLDSMRERLDRMNKMLPDSSQTFSSSTNSRSCIYHCGELYRIKWRGCRDQIKYGDNNAATRLEDRMCRRDAESERESCLSNCKNQ